MTAPAIQLPEQITVLKQIEAFMEAVSALVEAHYRKNYPSLTPPEILMNYGQRYARIIKRDKGNKYGSVYCFIDLRNGDILKAAGYKAPAKGKRGNIFANDLGMSGVNPFGANYLK